MKVDSTTTTTTTTTMTTTTTSIAVKQIERKDSAGGRPVIEHEPKPMKRIEREDLEGRKDE
jgi:hypothetical protein